MSLKKPPGRKGHRQGGEQARERILIAAGRVFSQDGFHAATVRNIARAAGCNLAAIKYYFGDKAGLVAAVMERMMARVQEGGGHMDPAAIDDPREALRQWVVWVLRSARRRQRADGVDSRLLMQALAIRGPMAAKLAIRLGTPVRTVIESLITRLCGPLDEATLHFAFVFVFSLCSNFVHGGAVMENVGIAVPDDDALMESLAQRLTDFIIGGLTIMAVPPAKRPGARR